LFSYDTFNTNLLKAQLTDFAEKEQFPIEWEMEEEVSLIGNINGIKVDMIRFPYPLIDNLIIEDNIRILSPKDIAPMKLSAIAQRGAKKDFFDMYELLKMYSLQEMLHFYEEKFPHSDITFLLRALAYFDDAEKQNDPIMLKSLTRKEVKKEISKQVKGYMEMSSDG
jgi:predicted nucleotidyltransferase component of viral defense system